MRDLNSVRPRMKTDPIITSRLNESLKTQLTTINQSFLHARIMRHWGLEALDAHFYAISITAMKSADSIIDRVLFLEGMPNLQAIGKIQIGEDVKEIIDCELRLMNDNQSQIIESIRTFENHRDYESRSLLSPILNAIEEYIDWLETQQWLITEMGAENYIQSQIGGNA